MATGDDKPASKGSGGGGKSGDPPSGEKPSRFSKTADPFDEDGVSRAGDPGDSAAEPEEDETSSVPSAEEEPARRRLGFRRRSRGAAQDDAPGRRVASLGDEEGYGSDLGDADLDDADLDDLPEPPPSRFRRPPWWAVVGGLVLALVVVLILYGEYNTQRYFLVCAGSRAEAHQGRGFPWPFGHGKMTGAPYQSVPLGDDSQCQAQEMESEAELIHAVLKLVIAQVERLSHSTRAKELAAARRLVSQGFQLARSDKKQQVRLQQLRATLDFQQGRVVMRDLEATLQHARRLFSQAEKHEAVNGKEAVAWIRVVDHLLDRLRRRLAGDPKPPKRVTARSPQAGMSPPPTSMSPDPKPGAMKSPRARASPTPAPAPIAVPDAGVSGGGILL